MPLTFKVSQVRLDGSLVTLDNLGHSELDKWMHTKYGRYATIRVEASNGKSVTYTDNGQEWEKVK